jgi:hypothetical protein
MDASTGSPRTSRTALFIKTSRRRFDATELLATQHRQVERLLSKISRCRVVGTRAALVEKLCAVMSLHAVLEKEVFYPAFLTATRNTELHRQAEFGLENCIKLLQQVEEHRGEDHLLDARMKIVADAIRHHIREEEKPDGVFAAARIAGMDLPALGQRMRARKYLMKRGFPPPRRRRPLSSRSTARVPRMMAGDGLRHPSP